MVVVSVDASTGPTQERARRTRAAILQAAAEAIAANGYRGAPTSGIAAAAGVTKGALAFHFPAKSDLAVAIVEDFYSRSAALLDDAHRSQGPVLDRIAVALRSTAVLMRDDATVRAAVRLQAERGDVDAELPTPYVAAMEALAGLYHQASGAGELRPGLEPRALARMTVSGYYGVQHVSWILDDRADVVERWDEYWDVFRVAVAA